MRKRFPLALAAFFGLAFPLSADIVSKRFDWQPVSGIQKVNMESNEIVISQIRFDLGDTIPPIRYSTAKAIVRVDNNSQQDEEVGVAIAVFDEQGNMIAAGNGGNKVGELNKGDREEFTIRFAYVYRNLKDARSFLISLETKPKGKWKPKKTEAQ